MKVVSGPQTARKERIANGFCIVYKANRHLILLRYLTDRFTNNVDQFSSRCSSLLFSAKTGLYINRIIQLLRFRMDGRIAGMMLLVLRLALHDWNYHYRDGFSLGQLTSYVVGPLNCPIKLIGVM